MLRTSYSTTFLIRASSDEGWVKRTYRCALSFRCVVYLCMRANGLNSMTVYIFHSDRFRVYRLVMGRQGRSYSCGLLLGVPRDLEI